MEECSSKLFWTFDPLPFKSMDPPSTSTSSFIQDGSSGGSVAGSFLTLGPLEEDLRQAEVHPFAELQLEATPVGEEEGIYFSIQDLEEYEVGKVGGNSSYLMMEDLIIPTPTTLGLGLHHLPLIQLEEEEDETLSSSRTSTTPSVSPPPAQLSPDEEEELLLPQLMGLPQRDKEEKQELKCKFCGFGCCSKSSLGIHERRHTGEKPYACKYCGRLFNSAQCCKHHERLHTGDKPFECEYCGKKYAVSTRLKRHERVHTREEPYKCAEPGCGKTFRWFDAFRDHRNTHNGVALYLCSVCGKSFTSYLKFYYHERGHFLKRERDKAKAKGIGEQGARPKVKADKPGKK